MAKRKISLLIIGAGPTGLGAGWRLHELGISDFLIAEASHRPGGLASSFVDANGFTWDIGGHVLHSHYDYFDRMFEEVMLREYLTHERESWVWLMNRFVPYPFQNNIHRLPEKERQECLQGLKNRQKRKPNNFAEWISSSFGDGIATYFLLPYNRKVWAYPPEQMNIAWVGDRVATVDIQRIEENIRLHRDDAAWGPNAVFHFPKKGGTGDIWRRVGKRIENRILYGKRLIRIEAKKHMAYFQDGSSYRYDHLLTSIPLTDLLPMISDENLPALDLHFSSVTIVGLGMKGSVPEHLKTKCWMYFPEDSALFFRATVLSNYSKYMAPKNHWSLMTEISFSSHRPLPPGDIIDGVILGAKKTKLIDKKPVSVWKFTAPYGYPTPTIGRDAALARVLPELERYGIYSRGRFGLWKYEVSNQDHAFMQGVEWVNHIMHGEKELTVYHPELVNAKPS